MPNTPRARTTDTAMPTLGPDFWGPALTGAAKLNGRMYAGFAVLGSEWLDFVHRRLKEDLALPQRISACRSPDEIRDTYAGFWRQAVDDYQNEMVAMARLGSSFIAGGVEATQGRADDEASR